MVEFLRFSQTIEGVLTAKIEPKNDILTIQMCIRDSDGSFSGRGE